MNVARLLVSVGIGVGLFGLLGLGAVLSIVAFTLASGSGGEAAFVGLFVGLAVLVLLLLLGPLEGLVAGFVVGLRHRGDWRGALPAGLLTGAFGYLFQLAVVLVVLVAAAALLGSSGDGGAGGAAASPTLADFGRLALLAVPAAFVSMVAALVTSTAFRREDAEAIALAGGAAPAVPEPAPAREPLPPAVPPPGAGAPAPGTQAALPDPADILRSQVAPAGDASAAGAEQPADAPARAPPKPGKPPWAP